MTEAINIESFKEKYKLVGDVHSSFFAENVSFNSKGLNHIFYKGSRSPRETTDIETRIRIFDRAVELLKKATTISGLATDNTGSKMIYYWEFIGVINNRRILVIVRKIGNGNKHFWSVIPAWKNENGGIINSGRNLKF